MKIYKIKVNGKTYKVELEAMDEVASQSTNEPKVEEKKPVEVKKSTGEGQKVVSPIQGTVLDVKVKEGQQVKKGDVLVIVEAMKLENEVVSPFSGEVSEILVSKGQAVSAKQEMFVIK